MKLFGRMEQTLRDSANGRAIQAAVDAVGRCDGGAASRELAYETCLELADDGPYDVSGPHWTVESLSRDFANSVTSTSGPILLEAASMVVGAHRVASGHEKPHRTRAERHADLSATTLFSALFSDWVKAWTAKYQVAGSSGTAEQMLRTSMMTWLLLDHCERVGLLPSDQ